MKKLSKSPLVYVVAQVRIGAILKMAKYVPEIQEHMRKAGYALYRETEVREVELGLKDPEVRVLPQWTFDSIDRTTGFSLQSGAVAFYTTAYDTHERFFEELEKGLQIIKDAAGVTASERLGLRYVDAFQASGEHDLADYLRDGLRGVSLEHIGARRPRSFLNFVTDTDVGGRLVVRIGLNTDGVLPPNLIPTDLVLDKTFDRQRPLGILDYDHFIEKPGAFSVEHAIARFKALHGIVADAFRGTISDFALEDWR